MVVSGGLTLLSLRILSRDPTSIENFRQSCFVLIFSQTLPSFIGRDTFKCIDRRYFAAHVTIQVSNNSTRARYSGEDPANRNQATEHKATLSRGGK